MLIIRAKVVGGPQLSMMGVCSRTDVTYGKGKKYLRSKQMLWAMREEESIEPHRQCSPFAGLFEAIRHALATKRMLSASIQREGAASEQVTPEGLLCGECYTSGGVTLQLILTIVLEGHEYCVTGAHTIDGEELVVVENPHGALTNENG